MNRQNESFSKSVRIDAPVEDVWELLTDPEQMQRWMSDTGITITFERKTGSPIRFRETRDGVVHESKGTITHYDPGKIFGYTYWTNISHLPDTPGNYSQLTFEVAVSGDQTVLTFTQRHFPAEAAYEHTALYWNVTLELLKKTAENRSL